MRLLGEQASSRALWRAAYYLLIVPIGVVARRAADPLRLRPPATTTWESPRADDGSLARARRMS